jgi:hypothetical protein
VVHPPDDCLITTSHEDLSVIVHLSVTCYNVHVNFLLAQGSSGLGSVYLIETIDQRAETHWDARTGRLYASHEHIVKDRGSASAGMFLILRTRLSTLTSTSCRCLFTTPYRSSI